MVPSIDTPDLPVHKSLTTYTTIEEFAQRNGVSVSTVKRHYREIPGIKKIGLEDYMVAPGTRYPLDRRGYRLKTNSDRINVLMTAICLKKYISHNELQMDEYEFQMMLYSLEKDGYIEKNEYADIFSSYAYANAYNCTKEGEKFYQDLQEQKREKRNAMISQTLDWVDRLTDIGKKLIPGTVSNDK